MKVCTIEKENDIVMFDGTPCYSANNAYLLFRTKYNKALGKATYKKFGHVGQRNERITDVGIDFLDDYKDRLRNEFGSDQKVKCYIIGLLGPSYCRILGQESFTVDLDSLDSDKSERYIDWLLSSGMKNTRLYGRKDKIKRIASKKQK